MKIHRLDLTAFGSFTDASIDLHEGEEGLHLIYGPNEAGKSTALRALRCLLFGFPHRTPDDFRHPASALRIGGKLSSRSGETLEIVRRKGRKNTLRGPGDDHPVSEERLTRFLGGVDEVLFAALFGLDHSGLVQGGRELLEGKGEVGRLLFAAGAGIPGLRRIQAALSSEAEALFKPSAQKPRINEAVARFHEVKKALRDAELNGRDWADHDQALVRADSEKIRVVREIAEKTGEKNRLERLKDAFPLISRRRELLAEYQAASHAVLLPQDFPERLRTAFEEMRLFEIRKTQAEDRLRMIRNQRTGIVVPRSLIDEASAVADLFQELGGIRKAAADRLKLSGLLTSLKADTREILRGLRPGLDLSQAETLRPSREETAEVAELGSGRDGLVARREAAAEETETLRGVIRDLEEKLEAIGTLPDIEDLRRTAESVHRLGDLEGMAADRESEARKTEAALALDLRRLPYGDWRYETLSVLPLPSGETIDAWERRLTEAGERVRAVRAERTAAEQDLLEAHARLAEAEGAGGVPTEADLVSSREFRDQGWAKVKTAWSGAQKFDDSAPVIVSYEDRVRRADELADRLRREADRVARKAEGMAGRDRLAVRMTRLTEVWDEARRAMADAETGWRAVWDATGIVPCSPREMGAWVRAAADILARGALWRSQTAELEKLRAMIKDWAAALSAALNPPGRETDHVFLPKPEKGALASLLAAARKAVAAWDGAAARRDHWRSELEDRRRALAASHLRLERAETALSRWHAQWAQAMKRLGLSPDAAPAVARTLLEDLRLLFEKLKEAEILEKRMQGMDRDADAFAGKVRTLAERIAPDLSDRAVGSPGEAITVINARLTEARKLDTEVDGMTRQIRVEEKRLAEAEAGIAGTAARISALCQEARCDHPDALSGAWERSENRRRIETAIREIEDRLHRLSAGAALDAFIAEADAENPDLLEMTCQDLDRAVAELENIRSGLDQTIGGERAVLARMDGGDRAAEQASLAEQILAGLESDAAHYARLKISAELLRLAIDHYREQHQGPVLERAGDLFARLTATAFEGLRMEFTEKNEAVLAGVRKGSREIVPMEAMSDGTADQLFLAVRLASLETYLEAREPLPFIADDILIQFDDDRAAAALSVLAGISRKTQVLFFTHHRHLVDLARSRIDPACLFIHHLL